MKSEKYTRYKMNTTIIEEKDVTSESISDLFKSAFFKVSDIDEKKKFLVEGDTIDITVDVDNEQKWIRFYLLYVVDDKSLEELLLATNHANERKTLVRFFIVKQDDLILLVADYTMSYETGVIPFQVVNIAKFFEKVGVYGIREILGFEDTVL